MTRPVSEIRRAQALAESGLPLLTISRELGIARATIRDWRNQGFEQVIAARIRRSSVSDDAVERAQADPGAYAYLFGQYLGDGSIQRSKNGVPKLRVFCFSGYPGIVGRVVATGRAILPGKVSAYKVRTARMVVVTTYWTHLPSLFPQDGPGRKHDRLIILDDWQNTIVLAHPKPFLRGLIESDGCRSVNWVNGKNYPRYFFSNHSDDIRHLCTRTLDQLGVHWTQTTRWDVAISKRPDVEFLDSFIGPKW